jgi:VanZ family protein
MFGLGYTQKNVLLAFLLTLYVGVVELAQLWVPGRHARLSDFIIDAIAVNVGVLMVSLTRRMTV